MRRALFFDIDGTLVNFQGRMPDSAKHALRRLQESGHLIVICSGRSVYQIYPWLLNMGFDGVIAAAGAYVAYGQEMIYEHYMDKRTVGKVCALLEEAQAAYSAQAKSGLIVTEHCKRRMVDRFRSIGEGEALAAQIEKDLQVDDHLEMRSDIQKYTFFDSKIPLSEIQKRLAQWCDLTTLSFDRPTDKDGEISSRGINKSFGIRKFIAYTGLAREGTVAFGDGANDLDMLEYAQVGVAMGNAIDDLKARANFVTRDIDDDGIAYALEELGLW